MEFLDALQWRYASKKMNGQLVPADKLEKILEAIRFSPSSAGLQPYKVLVISDHLLKGKIHELAAPQPQVLESSQLLVFAYNAQITEAMVDEYMNSIARIREVELSTLSAFADAIKGGILTRSETENQQWAARQAYIGLGFGLAAAALEGVDSTAMEGFNPAKLDELLGLKEKGLKSVALLALGYRDESKDFLSKAKKVRKPKEEFFIRLG